MSRYWGYSKRPKNWKKLLQAEINQAEINQDKREEINDKIITSEKPPTKPADKVPKILDSSLTYS
jgi:hypothetical protein